MDEILETSIFAKGMKGFSKTTNADSDEKLSPRTINIAAKTVNILELKH
jgi:hypothetical protein